MKLVKFTNALDAEPVWVNPDLVQFVRERDESSTWISFGEAGNAVQVTAPADEVALALSSGIDRP